MGKTELKVAVVHHVPSFSPGSLLTLLFSQFSRSCHSLQPSKASHGEIYETDLGSQTIVLFVNIHPTPIFTNA